MYKEFCEFYYPKVYRIFYVSYSLNFKCVLNFYQFSAPNLIKNVSIISICFQKARLDQIRLDQIRSDQIRLDQIRLNIKSHVFRKCTKILLFPTPSKFIKTKHQTFLFEKGTKLCMFSHLIIKKDTIGYFFKVYTKISSFPLPKNVTILIANLNKKQVWKTEKFCVHFLKFCSKITFFKYQELILENLVYTVCKKLQNQTFSFY